MMPPIRSILQNLLPITTWVFIIAMMVDANVPPQARPFGVVRGGASGTTTEQPSSASSPSTHHHHSKNAFDELARAMQSHMTNDDESSGSSSSTSTSPPEIAALTQAFQSLSAAQQTFKGLDGMAHEAYQRTSSSKDKGLDGTAPGGRARRSAARLGATADGLAACEWCEVAQDGHFWNNNNNTTRLTLLVNTTTTTPFVSTAAAATRTTKSSKSSRSKSKSKRSNSRDDCTLTLRVLVFWEPDYTGGRGLHHGGLQEHTLETTEQSRGRLVVVLTEDGTSADSLTHILQVLHRPAKIVSLPTRREVASVQPVLYQAAGQILEDILRQPLLQHYQQRTALHFVGRSLAGGVAALASAMVEGALPLPKAKTRRNNKKEKRLRKSTNTTTEPNIETGPTNASTTDLTNSTAPPFSVQGCGRGRTSATVLGAPPPFSANVDSSFITCILYGDDIVFRTSHDSLLRLQDRTRRALQATSDSGGVIGSFVQHYWQQPVHRLRDTVSLASANLWSHAQGSHGEEARLAIPGRAYLLRPRRLGGSCSLHQVGSQLLKGGREALRAVVLWQLNDVLLTPSLLKHHALESYIQGLDKVQLRGVAGGNGSKDGTSGDNQGDDDDDDDEPSEESLSIDSADNEVDEEAEDEETEDEGEIVDEDEEDEEG